MMSLKREVFQYSLYWEGSVLCLGYNTQKIFLPEVARYGPEDNSYSWVIDDIGFWFKDYRKRNNIMKLNDSISKDTITQIIDGKIHNYCLVNNMTPLRYFEEE